MGGRPSGSRCTTSTAARRPNRTRPISPPGKLRQFDIFKKLDLDAITMTGSLKIEAVSGGAVAVYATEIDNRTQDSIFIPAQRLFMGLAR